MNKQCECGESNPKLRVFGSGGVVRVAYICVGCYMASEYPDGTVVNYLTISDLARLIQAINDPTY